ncbi:hypothetical protein [Massilia sp.]|uniref:hypothetical protein n=1 Tax=Massilia sp. TaxID=1882437 RepID=UPI00289FF169|nr:hypothetical protein [Massilia sp.]
MNRSQPVLEPAAAAVARVLGKVGDVQSLLWAFAAAPEDMIAVYVDGDWEFDGSGTVGMDALFGAVPASVSGSAIICAWVVKGDLMAPNAILCDLDLDWAPSLIVGGSVHARGMLLGGGHTRICGDLSLHGTLCGVSNHGELDVLGPRTRTLS